MSLPDLSLKVDSWESIKGTTWVVVEHLCILGFYKSRKHAEERLREIKAERKAKAEQK